MKLNELYKEVAGHNDIDFKKIGGRLRPAKPIVYIPTKMEKIKSLIAKGALTGTTAAGAAALTPAYLTQKITSGLKDSNVLKQHLPASVLLATLMSPAVTGSVLGYKRSKGKEKKDKILNAVKGGLTGAGIGAGAAAITKTLLDDFLLHKRFLGRVNSPYNFGAGTIFGIPAALAGTNFILPKIIKNKKESEKNEIK